jgi:hypothetical protein
MSDIDHSRNCVLPSDGRAEGLVISSEFFALAAERDRLTAEVEQLRAALRDAYEVYAGSDGFIPATAAEGYQQQIIKQMVDCISAALSQLAQEPRT